MKSRLDEIDQTMLQVKTVVNGASVAPSKIDQDAFSVAMLMTDQAMDGSKSNTISKPSVQATPRYLFNGQYYGTSSLASVFSEIGLAIEARLNEGKGTVGVVSLNSSNEALRNCQLTLQHMAKTMMDHDALDLPNKELPPTLPPRDVLEATVDTYFGQVNAMMPVFKRDAFCENIQRIYVGGPDHNDNAWILCFNNAILQTMSTDTVELQSPIDDGASVAQGETPETELLRPLLVNYRRGLGTLHCLLEPKLINVQALLSMVSSCISCFMRILLLTHLMS